MRGAKEVFAGAHFARADDRIDFGEPRFVTVGMLDSRLVAFVWTLRGSARRIISMRHRHEREAKRLHLAALADGETPPPLTSEPPNPAAFVASLSSAWHAGEIRPTFSVEAKPRYLRSLQRISA